MNRSVLIVIVDFLLISLLAFSRIEDADVTQEQTGTPSTVLDTTGNRQDLMEVLKVSLDKEQESRALLHEQLRQAETQLETREQLLGDRERVINEAQQLLQLKDEEAARLARERSSIEQQFTLTRASMAELQSQLTNTVREASLSRQQLEAIRNDLRAREQEEAILKRRLDELEQNRQLAEEQKEQLANQLQLAEAEKRLVREQLESVQGTVEVERQEKARLQEHATKLAEGVTTLGQGVANLSQGVTTLEQGVSQLADKSKQLTQEIREYRPLAPNSVFHEFVTNRVRADFRAVRSGVFGREINREKEAQTVLMRQGGQVYAIYHVDDTPLSFSVPGIDWDWLIGNMRRGSAVVRMERISFLAVDPRVVVVPLTDAKATELGSKVYTVPQDPFRFQEAILVGADEGYYGECKFQLDADRPQYVRIQRERFSWLVGKFAPSSGDLVFTKGGELLGLMVNKEYCLLLTELSPAYHVDTGIGIGSQRTGTLLSQLYNQVARMPGRLQ